MGKVLSMLNPEVDLYLVVTLHAKRKLLRLSQDLSNRGSNLEELQLIISMQYLLLLYHQRDLTSYDSSGLNSTPEKSLQLRKSTSKALLLRKGTKSKFLIRMVYFL